MAFDDLSEFFYPHLDLPIRGKVYTIPAENATDGLRIRQITSAGGFTETEEHSEALKRLGATWVEKTVQVPIFLGTVQQFDTETNEPLMRDTTIGEWQGGVYQEMADDGLTMDEIIHAGLTALMKTAFGTERAEEFWSLALNNRDVDAEGKAEPPQSGAPAVAAAPKRKPAKKAARKRAPSKRPSSSKAGTGSTTRAQARTATTTPEAPTTTP